MIEILILYILNRYDVTIYKIAKTIETNFFAYAKPSFGTINPALKRLEALGCVEFISKITEGGKQSKLFSITEFGKRHLKDLMLDAPLQNPSNILNDASVLLFCLDFLGGEDRAELLRKLSNHLNIYKIEIEKKLSDAYSDFSEHQQNVLKATYKMTDDLISAVEKC